MFSTSSLLIFREDFDMLGKLDKVEKQLNKYWTIRKLLWMLLSMRKKNKLKEKVE